MQGDPRDTGAYRIALGGGLLGLLAGASGGALIGLLAPTPDKST